MNTREWDLTVIAVDEVPEADLPNLLETIVRQAASEGPIIDVETVTEALLKRERAAPTDLGDGVAVPHAETPAVERPTVVVGCPNEPIRFRDGGDPVSIVVLLLIPEGEAASRRPLLAAVARTLLDVDVREAIIDTADRSSMRRHFERAIDRELS